MQFGNDDLAKYTFLPAAGDFIRAQGISIADLANPDYKNVLDRAEQRVTEAISPGKVSDKTGESREIEIMSFPVSLMLVKSTKLDHLMNRYALAEALRVEAFLKQEKNDKMIEDIFQNFLGIKLERNRPGYPAFKISIADFVARAVQFRKPEWKLVNRVVQNGKVIVSQQDLIRLIREEIRDLIMERLSGVNVPKLPPAIEGKVKKLIQIAPPPPRSTFNVINVSPENFPPCVKEALNLLEKGQNVPHYGRFLMATYLLAVGKTVDEIMALFPKAPDFKQSVTKYQVEHIAGLRGGRTRYSVPSCATLQTHSFCFKDPVKCYEISSPTQYPSTKAPQISRDASEKKNDAGERKGKGKKTQEVERRRDWTKPRR
ncbi:MAG: DNA primase large subunit PriL [Thaumarchaeota archaeon]|nr:DNA primase large subunit PriL [Nitrososphaerota archaeon]